VAQSSALQGETAPSAVADGTSETIYNYVSFDVKPERRAEFLEVIRANEHDTLALEPLAESYRWGEDVNVSNRFHFHEAYRGGLKGFLAHLNSDHIAQWNAFEDTDPFTADPDGPHLYWKMDSSNLRSAAVAATQALDSTGRPGVKPPPYYPNATVPNATSDASEEAVTADNLGAALVLALVSAFCNAVFFTPNRLESVKAADIHPIIYNWYTTMGVFILSWVMALFLPLVDLNVFTFIPAGLAGGALFTLALLFSCFALPELGLSIAMGIWCGAATLISFLWGTIGPAEISRPLANIGLSVLGILSIVVGILGIIWVDMLGNMLCGCFVTKKTDDAGEKKADETSEPVKVSVRGVVYALLVGLFGGSMLVPLSFIPEEYSGLKGLGFIPAFGTGSLIMGTLVVVVQRVLKGPQTLAIGQTLWAGLTSGTVWQVGNIAQVVAQSYFLLPYAIAYPIFQASLVFAGFLGIVLFKEITGAPAVIFFFVSAFTVVIGAGLLAIYGPQSGEEE